MLQNNSLTVSEVKSLINSKFLDLRTLSSKSASQILSKNFKAFINLCTSLSIKMIQYSLYPDTLEVLIKASEADKLLCEIGSMQDKYWQGRLLTYHCLAYLYYKTNQIKKSLTILHDAQQIAEVITHSKFYVCPDFNFTANLLIFMNLWKARKFKDSKEYLESTKLLLLQISKIGIKSKISNLSRLNLNGLLTMSFAAQLCLENNHKRAIEICENALEFLQGDEISVRPLIHRFIRSIKLSDQCDIEKFMTKDFESIVLVSCLIPYVSIGTPVIKACERKETSNRSTSRNSSVYSNKRVKSVPQSKVKNNLVKNWWNSKTFVANKNFRVRRASNVSSRSAQGNKSLENSFKGERQKMYSPSIGSTISTPRRKNLNFRAATMAELPLQIIKSVFNRPLSSK